MTEKATSKMFTKVYMELCPALQGGEQVPHTETGLGDHLMQLFGKRKYFKWIGV